jgi:tRNA threonylcarbamoyladenosine biosynthesis protein TsaB
LTRILALDTSSWWGSLALLAQPVGEAAPTLVAELGLRVTDSHAVHLLRRVDFLLAEAGWSRSDPHAYVSTRGPGSFTGIRIGMGTVGGLALATGRPCLGVSTLEALVEAHGPAECERIAVIPAGRGEVYAARYDAASSPPRELRPAWLGRPSEITAAREGSAVLVCSHATDLEALGLRGRPGAVRAGRAPANIAGAAGRLALLRGLASADPSFAPLYVRLPDAELKSRKR